MAGSYPRYQRFASRCVDAFQFTADDEESYKQQHRDCIYLIALFKRSNERLCIAPLLGRSRDNALFFYKDVCSRLEMIEHAITG